MSRDLVALANEHGLVETGTRPPFGAYLRDLGANRYFIAALARGQAFRRNRSNYLGQAWLVINPILLAGAFYLVFGVILKTDRGIDNFTGFLVVGVFMYTFVANVLQVGSASIVNRLSLIRALRFPRAALPLSVTTAEMLTLLPATGVMLVIVLVSGEPVAWSWLLVPVVLFQIYLFSAGMALIAARLVATAPDLRNLVPFTTQLLRYMSGVFFSVSAYASIDSVPGMILNYQPVAVYLTLARSTVLGEVEAGPELWAIGAGWAVLFFAVGIVVFWRAEARYGRD